MDERLNRIDERISQLKTIAADLPARLEAQKAVMERLTEMIDAINDKLNDVLSKDEDLFDNAERLLEDLDNLQQELSDMMAEIGDKAEENNDALRAKIKNELRAEMRQEIQEEERQRMTAGPADETEETQPAVDVPAPITPAASSPYDFPVLTNAPAGPVYTANGVVESSTMQSAPRVRNYVLPEKASEEPEPFIEQVMSRPDVMQMESPLKTLFGPANTSTEKRLIDMKMLGNANIALLSALRRTDALDPIEVTLMINALRMSDGAAEHRSIGYANDVLMTASRSLERHLMFGMKQAETCMRRGHIITRIVSAQYKPYEADPAVAEKTDSVLHAFILAHFGTLPEDVNIRHIVGIPLQRSLDRLIAANEEGKHVVPMEDVYPEEDLPAATGELDLLRRSELSKILTDVLPAWTYDAESQEFRKMLA